MRTYVYMLVPTGLGLVIPPSLSGPKVTICSHTTFSSVQFISKFGLEFIGRYFLSSFIIFNHYIQRSVVNHLSGSIYTLWFDIPVTATLDARGYLAWVLIS